MMSDKCHICGRPILADLIPIVQTLLPCTCADQLGVLKIQLEKERARLNHIIDTACLMPAGGGYDMKLIEIRLVINEWAVFPDGSRTLDNWDWPDAEVIRTLVRNRADEELEILAKARQETIGCVLGQET